MNKVIHVGTKIDAIFGFLDDEGNIVSKQPISINLDIWNEQALLDAYNQINKIKDELKNRGPKLV